MRVVTRVLVFSASIAITPLLTCCLPNLTAVHLPFDPAAVITVCGGITNYDWPWLEVGMKITKDDCREALAEASHDRPLLE